MTFPHSVDTHPECAYTLGMNTTRQDTTTTDRALVAIDYHAAQAAYSATVTTPALLRARILRRARQTRLGNSWGLRTSTGTRNAS